MSAQNLQADCVPTFGRVALVVCSMINFGMALGLPLSLSAMFLDWQDYFAVSRAHTAAVQSVCVGILCSASVIPGYLMDRFGPRFTLLLGTALATLGFIPGIFATSIDHLIITTGAISGSGFCLMQLPCYPCATIHFTKYRSLVLMMCGMGLSLGHLGLPKLIRFLVDEYGWRGAYVIIIGLILNTFVTGLVMTSVVRVRSLKRSTDVTNMEIDVCSDSNKGNEYGSGNFTRYEELTELFIGNGMEEVEDSKSYEISKEVPAGKSTHDSENKDLIVNGFNDVTRPDSLRMGPDIEHAGSELIHQLNKTSVNGHGAPRSISRQTWRTRLQQSRWAFMDDPVCLLMVAVTGLSSGTVVSFIVLLLDFARTKGFDGDTDGVLFIQVVVLCTLAGRFVAGVANLVPHCRSAYVFGAATFLTNATMVTLGRVTEFSAIIGLLAVMGIGMGTLFTNNPKLAMDIDSVDAKTYPLALGVMCTVEGLVDMVVPVIMGSMVDQTGAYYLPLTLFGSLGLAATLLFLFVFIIHRRRAVSGQRGN